MKRNSLLIMLLMALFMPLALHAQEALPFSYGFEDDELPSSWTMDNCTTGSDGETGIFAFGSSYAHSGTNVFGFLYTSNPPQYLVAPRINGPTAGVLVQFYYRNYNTNYGVESFKVGYTTGRTSTTWDNYTWTDEITLPTDTDWHLFSETFPVGRIQYICIQCTSDDVLLLLIDDFTISEIPSCYTPSDLTVSNVTARTADLSWTPNPNGSERSWQIMVNESQTITVNSTPSYSFTGLTPETTYSVKVRANCGDSYSDWTDAVSFTTDPSCFDPTNVTISDITPVSAVVGWTSDANSYDMQLASTNGFQVNNTWLQYDNGTATNFYGSNSSSTWTWGAMYPASMLTGNIATLQKVAVYETSYYTSDYYVFIGIGGDSAPEELVYYQAITPVGDGWNEVTLNQPVSLDPDQNVWIILQVTGTYVLTVGDCSDANNQWYYGGSWQNAGISGKGWLIRGEFEGITYNANALSWNTEEDVDNPYAMNNLTPATLYLGKVRANCGSQDGYSNWVDFSFYTPSACDMPTDAAIANVTNNSAEFSWNGFADAYNVRYRNIAQHNVDNFRQVGRNTTTTGDYTDYTFTLSAYSGQGYIAVRHYNVSDMFWLDVQTITVKDARGNVVFQSDFSAGIPEGWNTIDNDGDGNNWIGNSGFVYSESYNNSGPLTPDNWLITPLVDLGGSVVVNAKGQDASYASEIFGVFVSTTQLQEAEWIVEEAVSGTSFTLTDLESETLYEAQVQVDGCDNAEWTNSVTFTTLADNVFQIDGEWNVASNWKNNVVPEEGADVLIQANAIIPAGYIANAGAITIGQNGNLTIEDGGQLIHTNEGVVATVEKNIIGVGEENWNADNNGGYYLISTPVVDENYYGSYELTFPENVTNMLENEYDLYDFDYSAELEWLNYKNEEFYLWKNYGYLYANSGDGSEDPVTLQFTGVTTPAKTSLGTLTGYYLGYTEDEYDFANWALYGNPYLCNTYIWVYDITNDEVHSYDHYQLNETRDEFVESDDALAPVEGAFFVSEGASQYALVAIAESSLGKKNFGSYLRLNLTQNGKLIDAARIRFGEGDGMAKIQLNPNHTKVYFTQDNKDYAVVYSEAQGEMPVNFKAEKNGTYTLSFNTENTELGYLHLIDNLTGIDVDLLAKLVFATGNASDDNFAFFSNGSFVINNEGNATLQVIDVNGRILKSESINGCANLNVNAASGVYMIRLVNGNDVKVQKVVVR